MGKLYDVLAKIYTKFLTIKIMIYQKTKAIKRCAASGYSPQK